MFEEDKLKEIDDLIELEKTESKPEDLKIFIEKDLKSKINEDIIIDCLGFGPFRRLSLI
ncbi:MAG: hypothetical protein ACTSU2_00385 [Promethearchaeota archaeon]